MRATIQQIGDWQLDHATLRLVRGAQSHRLPRLQYDLLVCLVEQAGTLVSREALIERAWQRRVVGDEVLSRQVASLRQLLGDDAREPRYIETVPKVGYRLLVPVSAVAAAPAEAASGEAAGRDPEPPATTSDPSGRSPAWRMAALLAIAGAVLAAGWWVMRPPAPPGPAWTPAAFAAELPLASDPELESAPRWSRDGRWLAYARRAADARRATVWLARSDGASARRLFEADGQVGAIAFAPDASALAITEAGAEGCRVRRFSLPEGPLHTLHACGSASGLDWSPDGRVLAFTAADPAGGALALLALPLDGQVALPLTAPPPGAGMDSAPRWSPDGARLAFARGTPGEQQVYLAAGDGAQARRLGADDRNRVGGLAWSADGSQLLVAMDAAGFPALFAVDPADGARTLLGARGAAAVDASAAAVVYEQRRYDANVWRHPLDGNGEPRRLTPSARYDAQPAISPDGRRIAYVSSRDGPGSIWLLDDAGAEQRLALDGDGIWNRPAWSPDGRRLLLTRYLDGRPTIAEHDPASGRTRRLGPDGAPAAAAAYAGDGSIVYLGQCGSAACLLRLREAQAPTPIDGTANAVEFRVGGAYVAWQDDRGALAVLALDGSPVVQPPPALREPLGGAWTFAGGLLALQVDQPDGAALWVFDPASGAQRRIAALAAGSSAGPSLAVDAALQVALVARIDGLEADLLRVPARRDR